jgi:putative ABC transport system ATP-binding protein
LEKGRKCGMEILRCEKLSKVYGSGQTRVTALEGVDLSVEAGEFVAIIGTSGSGKSTLLHLLGGVDQPSSGRVLVENTDISTLSEKQRAVFRRRKVGLVYQFYNLIPSIDVRQNILLPMLLDNQKPDEGRFTELTEILGLGERLTHLPNQLSGGQQQRAAIARALIYRPAILLADEPTGNLDKRNSEEILGLLKLSNKKYKQTILLITHDEKIALEADRIITIEDGKILSDKGVGK